MKRIIISLFLFFLFITISLQQSNYFPNIGYIGSGYDLIYGNPRATKAKGGPDPGFRAPIFDLSNYSLARQTPDKKYNIPNGVSAESCTMCSLDVKTMTIAGGFSYFESIKEDISINGGFWVFSFRASEDTQYVFQYSYKYKNIFSSSHAVCCVYIASLEKYEKPSFSTDFIDGVNQLPTNYDEETYAKFIKEFGTHVVTKATMGSRWGQVSRFSEVSYYQMSSSNFDMEIGAKFSFIISVGVKKVTDIQKRHAEFFQRFSSEQLIYETGGSFPENFDLHTWSEQSKNNPMPLKISLETLDTLLNQQFFPHDININQKSQNLKMALNGYCNYLVKKGVIHSCQALPPDPALPKPATFGGFFQIDDGHFENIANPYTGQTNCMNGYTPHLIAGYLRGAGGGWAHQFVCILNSNNRPDGIYGGSFSVWYSPSPHPLNVNPFTNGINCPPGYNAYLTSTTKLPSNYGANIFVCLNASVPVGVGTMAGLYQSGSGLSVPNLYTGVQSCPTGYTNFPVGILRNPNFHEATTQYVCLNNVF